MCNDVASNILSLATRYFLSTSQRWVRYKNTAIESDLKMFLV